MEKKKKAGLLWTVSMLLLWINGFVLISKGRKLKILTYTISGIILTIINFSVPIICMTTSNGNLMVFLTILWLVSPIVALIIALRNKNEYIYKMSLKKFAKEKEIKGEPFAELEEKCSAEISLIEKPSKQRHTFSNILLVVIGAFLLFILVVAITSPDEPENTSVANTVVQNEITEKMPEATNENTELPIKDDVKSESPKEKENKNDDDNKAIDNKKAQTSTDTKNSSSTKDKIASVFSKEKETESEKNKVECHIFIRYNIAMFTGNEKNSEITVMFNDKEVEKLNVKDAREYIVWLPEGENTITLKREWYDKETVELDVSANSDQKYNISLEYTYSTIQGSGSIELCGPDFTSDAYTWREFEVDYEK